MISAERKLIVTAAWTLTVLGAWSLIQRTAHAEELPAPHQVQVEFKITGSGVPVLSKIPYLGRLFINDPKPATECCEKECEIAEKFERIGIDFTKITPGLHIVEEDFETGFTIEESEFSICPACPANAQCSTNTQCSTNAQCSTNCCVACTATACPGLAACCKQTECVAQACATESKCVGDEPCQKTACIVSSRLGDLVAENMALNTALEAKDQILHLQTEMMERFATLMAEKVEVEAKLEFTQQLHAEREKSRQKIEELAQENNRLKNMVEMAAVRRDVEASKSELAQANQRLKERVTELELASRDSKSGVRVAKKARESKTQK
jgi:outer membrane murein-binding lipoprotein Lpp